LRLVRRASRPQRTRLRFRQRRRVASFKSVQARRESSIEEQPLARPLSQAVQKSNYSCNVPAAGVSANAPSGNGYNFPAVSALALSNYFDNWTRHSPARPTGSLMNRSRNVCNKFRFAHSTPVLASMMNAQSDAHSGPGTCDFPGADDACPAISNSSSKPESSPPPIPPPDSLFFSHSQFSGLRDSFLCSIPHCLLRKKGRRQKPLPRPAPHMEWSRPTANGAVSVSLRPSLPTHSIAPQSRCAGLLSASGSNSSVSLPSPPLSAG